MKYVWLFAEDEVYCKLEECFCGLGRGRRPNLPKNINITNKTLLQINLLRINHRKSWEFEQECEITSMVPT